LNTDLSDLELDIELLADKISGNSNQNIHYYTKEDQIIHGFLLFGMSIEKGVS